jgi:hypothetical protein
MSVADRLAEAVRLVEEAEVPSDLRAAAFGCVFNALDSSDSPTGGHLADMKKDGDPLDRIASRLGVSRTVAEHAFVVEGDSIEIVIPAGRFESAKSTATEQIALLVAAGRQAADLDPSGWTSVDHIRGMCEHFRRHDSSNFASTIKDMDEVFVVRGSGRDRKVRMSAPAWQAAGALVSSLTDVGGSSR